MHEFHELDWAAASSVERNEPTRQLYDLMRDLCGTDSDKLRELVIEITGETVSDHPEWYKNFSRGNYAWKKAHKIHEWLAKNHFQAAQNKYPELFQVPRTSDWDAFLERYLQEGSIEIVKQASDSKPSLGVVTLADETQSEAPYVRLGQKFYFKIDAPLDGFVVAFQEDEGAWHSIPLGDDQRRLRVPAIAGSSVLPRNGKLEPKYLVEHKGAVPKRFVFVYSASGDLIPSIEGITKKQDVLKAVATETTIQFVV
ncbi:hypothetical protein J7400_20925 [Shimia sp. R9_2]|uniref:hypothetical protein n=1 Tax=Shimia sp. R9_2 TaxID=2821112 RepID=UPI001ADB87A9|nr:hypothetical protein [Shimia sp. R9_2]MBO9399147.1 hypothetical protein [Shimia sp. R9_2]